MKQTIKPLKSFINVRLIPCSVSWEDIENLEINSIIQKGILTPERNVLDKVFLIALTKLLGEFNSRPDMEMPDMIGVTWSQNNLRKGYCMHPKGSIPKALLWRYFEPEKMENPQEKGLTFEDLMFV